MAKVYRTEILRDIILKELAPLGAYVYSQGQPNKKYNSDPSIYIKFRNPKLRSLRIGDHDGYEKYKYKWNLRIDGREGIEKDKGVTRFYYRANAVYDICNHIKNYSRKCIDKDLDRAMLNPFFYKYM